MFVSILIPIYNIAKYLPRCLDSLRAQTYENWEAVLIDDGSTDNSLDVAKRYQSQDSRFRVFSYPNAGVSATRNRALDQANGDAFLFVDGDDWIEPKTLEILVTHMERSGADVVQCGYVMDFGPIPFYRRCAGNGVYTSMEALKSLVENKGINNYPWGKLYRKSCYEGVRFPQHERGFEDTRTIFKTFLSASCIQTIPNRLVHYCQRSGSLTNKMSYETVLNMRQAYIDQENFLKERYGSLPFTYDRNHYNTDMVLIYTLILFCARGDDVSFEKGPFSWTSIPALYKLAYGIWLELACLKMGWKRKDIAWK